MSYRINKELTFDMAHMLDQHPGLCSNLHGHTYKIQACLQGETLDKLAMLGDFGELKQALKTITDPFDHAVVINVDSTDPFEQGLAVLVAQHDKKLVKYHGLPTAESMAKYFYHELQELVNEKVLYIRLWETPTSFAEYSEEA